MADNIIKVIQTPIQNIKISQTSAPNITISQTSTPNITISRNRDGEDFKFEDFTPEQLELLKGEIGPQGPQGDIGPVGPKGDKGDKGEQGIQGPQGLQGIQGIQGEKGNKGDQGDVGPVGPQGLKGDKGDKGDIGPQGPQGEKGDAGDIGPQGLQGIQGEIGPMGPQGIKGDIGEPFRINKTYSSISAMNNDIDNIEDCSFVAISTDTNEGDNGKLYVKHANALNYLLDLSGVQGIQGPVGPQGLKGDKGEKGDKGDVGDIGPQGIQGDIGPQGPRGIQGVKGDKGDIGPVGPKGDKGDKGDVGPQGIQGATGLQGPQGIQGPQGEEGKPFTYDMFTQEQLTALLDGNAATASKLETPRTISLAGKAVGSTSFDGSNDASINVTSVNADTATKATNDGNGNVITDTYLRKAGDTATGAIVAPSFQTGTAESNYFQCKKFRGEGNANTYYHAVDFGCAGHDQVDFYEYGGVWNFYRNTASTKGGTLVGSIKPTGWNGNVVGNVKGNADTATNADKLDGYHASDLIDLINTNKTEIGNKISLHNTDEYAHADIRQMFNSYLTLTGGTVTGTLNVPTQAITDNSTKVANTAFVQSTVDNKVSKLVNSAPATLDTLNELSNALGGDPNFATTVSTMIGQKINKTEADEKFQLKTAMTDYATNSKVDNIVNVMYPVGIIVEFAEDVDPNTAWVGTTWERMKNGRVLVSAGTSDSGTTYTVGGTGGEESHKLTTDEMPTHNHGTNTSSSGGHTHTGTTSTNGNHTHSVNGTISSSSYGANSGKGYNGDSINTSSAGNHNHSFTTSSSGGHSHIIDSDGGSQPHNNMQPYEVVNRWKRTA